MYGNYLDMVDVVKNNLDKIIDACKKHHVQSLYLFGSAARGDDFTQYSDIDFLIDYKLPVTTNTEIFYKVENDEKLLNELEAIVERKVDLIQKQHIKNKYLRYFINKDKKLIYGLS